MLFVRNLASTVTEEILEKTFSQHGKLERVKKLKDYAFIHFEERESAVKVWGETVSESDCLYLTRWDFCVWMVFHYCLDFTSQALTDLNGKDLEGEHIEIVFAKPPDQKRKERKAQRQAAKTQM